MNTVLYRAYIDLLIRSKADSNVIKSPESDFVSLGLMKMLSSIFRRTSIFLKTTPYTNLNHYIKRKLSNFFKNVQAAATELRISVNMKALFV